MGMTYRMYVEGSDQCGREELVGMGTAPSFHEGRACAWGHCTCVSALVLQPVFQMTTQAQGGKVARPGSLVGKYRAGPGPALLFLP